MCEDCGVEVVLEDVCVVGVGIGVCGEYVEYDGYCEGEVCYMGDGGELGGNGVFLGVGCCF